jgi:hypothetical protein
MKFYCVGWLAHPPICAYQTYPIFTLMICVHTLWQSHFWFTHNLFFCFLWASLGVYLTHWCECFYGPSMGCNLSLFLGNGLASQIWSESVVKWAFLSWNDHSLLFYYWPHKPCTQLTNHLAYDEIELYTYTCMRVVSWSLLTVWTLGTLQSMHLYSTTLFSSTFCREIAGVIKLHECSHS